MVSEENFLVSIVVITYNSSKYIIETLESAKNQSYERLELIISDDCSKDNTVELCKKWLVENKNRFERIKLLTVQKNSGIAANCNRGFYNAKGVWIKCIAGDDLLLPNCIDIFLENSKTNSESFFFSKMVSIPHSEYFTKMFDESFVNLNVEKNQLRYLLKGNYLPAPAFFIKTSAFLDLNGFDERFPFTEDYPLWIKALKKGYKFKFIEEKTVIYRIHQESISSSLDSNPFYRTMLKSLFHFRVLVLLPLQIKNGLFKYALLTIKSILYYFYLSAKSWIK